MNSVSSAKPPASASVFMGQIAATIQ
jgi:hypothetical protein